uniref:Branched-chain-amino-acid aminotransferase n=1 Tax=Solanum tuberosum TaxID=4113 RepID=M1ATS2_SOLTU
MDEAELRSGPILGLAPAPEYTFLVYACPVGNYFKEGTSSLNLYVEEDLHRASRGGAGGVKSITNYAPVLRAIKSAKDRGFSDVLYLDSINKKYIEEVEERLIEVEELNNVDEVFCTGTAVGIASVGSITYKGKRIEYKEKLTSKKLCSRLIEIQRGIIEDKRDWIVEIY